MQNQAIDPFGIVGRVLDSQFRVDRLVGEGGFSAVYRGHHLGLQEPIAIKCLKLPPSLSPPLVEQFAKRFRDESRILYRLSQGNLNVVRSIAAGTWQANTGLMVPYMILEWLDGRSLANEFTIRRTVGQQGRSLEEIVKLFGSAADGLGYAHAQGVVHRDLNPGNLFLANTPQGIKMKVLDFGVAKILDDSTLDIIRTQTVGQIRIFAPAYGAPEQFDDTIGTVGAASDVYAFALILLEALRDRCVNDGQHLGEFAQRAIDPNRRPTPRALGLEVSDEVEQIFARATKLDPRERWQSAGELWRALAIAVSAASEQKHAQAAMETPALAMPKPQGLRSTQIGIAPPAQARPQIAKRMDRTLPIGSAMPNLNAPRPVDGFPAGAQRPNASGTAAPPGGASARGPAPAGAPAPAEDSTPTDRPPHAPAIEEEEVPTRVGLLADVMLGESEDEVTRVRAPEPEMLRDTDAPGGPPALSEPPGAGGTLMMAPGGFSSSPALKSTLPLTGQHPLGRPSHPSSHGPAPAAGVSPQFAPQPQQPFQQPQQQPLPHQQQQPYPPQHNPHVPQQQQQQQQAMMQPPPHMAMQSMHGQGLGLTPQPPVAVQHAPQLADSMSLPPQSVVGVPKKSNTILFGAIGLGALALIGVGLAGYVLMAGKGSGTGPVASASAPSASSATANAPPPPPVVVPPVPTAEVADASETAQKDEAVAAASAAATATATEVTPTPTPRAQPTAAPTAQPMPLPTVQPTPTPVAVKSAGPPPDPNAFSESAARSRLAQANGILVFCKKAGGVTGPGTARVTFGTDGSVTAVEMDPPYAGTPAGDCVSGHFKRTKVNPFHGSPQTIKHSFEVPK